MACQREDDVAADRPPAVLLGQCCKADGKCCNFLLLRLRAGQNQWKTRDY